MEKGRQKYIDVMKGIGILLVCLGHCISVTKQPINTFLLSFHMPLFFFVSGLLLNRSSGGGTREKDIKFFVKRKVRTIIVPQLVCGIIGIFQNTLKVYVAHKDVTIVTIGLLGWFLIVLFLMEVIIKTVISMTQKPKHYLLCILFAVISFVLVNTIYIHYGEKIHSEVVSYFCMIFVQLCAALIFGFSGLVLYPIIEKYREKKMYPGFGLLLLILTAVLSMYNTPVVMGANNYGNIAMFLITSYFGIAATIHISIVLQDADFLSFFGKNSIIIYVNQFILSLILRGLVNKVFHTSTGEYPGFLIAFFCLVVVQYPIIWLSNKYVPFLFGKKRIDILNGTK